MEQNNSSDLLLVIDMQNVYTKGQEWACKGIEHASASILRLLNSQKTKQVIFTQYLATEHPDGVWKEYNKVNAAVNSDPWLNEMMPEFLPWVKTYPVFTKSVYSSFAIPEVVKAAKKARHLVISGVVAECCVLCCTLMMQMYNLNYSFQRKRIYVIIHLTLISISIAIHIIIKEYICNN